VGELEARSGGREDSRHAVVSGIAVRDLRVELLVALERFGPTAARRVDVDALVVREKDKLRCLVEERATPKLLLAHDLERRLARLRVRDLGDLRRERVDV